MGLTVKTAEEMQDFLQGPALDPPVNVASNFDSPKDLSAVFITICVVGTVVTAGFLGMRFYTRWMVMRRFIAEDFVLLAGWITFVAGINTTVYLAIDYSLGAHQWDIRVVDYVEYLRLFHEGTLLFCATMLLLRLSIIMQVLRHFVPMGTRNFTFWASHMLIYTNAIFWLSITLLEVFSCRPRKKLWEFYITGECIDRHAYLIAAGVMNLISDILLMFLPQRIIWSLSLSTKQKMELSPLFLIGTITCICSAVRLWQTIYQWPTQDMSHYIATAVMLWTVPEIACSVIVPCLPSLPQFLRIVRKRQRLPNSAPPRGMHIANYRNSKTAQTPISDVEYHELVMRTEMTIDSADHEESGPRVQSPPMIHVTGGYRSTKEFTVSGRSPHCPSR